MKAIVLLEQNEEEEEGKREEMGRGDAFLSLFVALSLTSAVVEGEGHSAPLSVSLTPVCSSKGGDKRNNNKKKM